MKVLLCGSGAAIHVLSAYVSAKLDTHVTILSLFPGEADKLRDAIPEEGIRCINDLDSSLVVGKPNAVISKAEDVPTDLDVILFVLPSLPPELYLKALKPYIKSGVTIGDMAGDGGFAFCAGDVLGSAFIRHSNLFALATFPWACRIIEYGKSVQVMETEKEVEVIVSPKYDTTYEEFTADILHNLFGSPPLPDPANEALAPTLVNSRVCHQTISKDITKSFQESLIFNRWDNSMGDKLTRALVSDEMMELKRILCEKYPGISKAYPAALVHPMGEAKIEDKKCFPNFTYRYFIDAPQRTRTRSDRHRKNRRACRRSHTYLS